MSKAILTFSILVDDNDYPRASGFEADLAEFFRNKGFDMSKVPSNSSNPVFSVERRNEVPVPKSAVAKPAKQATEKTLVESLVKSAKSRPKGKFVKQEDVQLKARTKAQKLERALQRKQESKKRSLAALKRMTYKSNSYL